MKKNITKYLYLFASILAVLTSCNSDPEYFKLTAPEDQMKVTAATDNLILDLANAKNEAVTFTWNDATDRRAETQISYRFRLYHQGDPTKKTELIDLGSDARSFSYTHKQLNDLLSSWNVNPGTEVGVVAEVIAEVTESQVYMKPELSEFEFIATGYDPNLYLLYNTGASTLRIAMEADNNDEGIYKWEGELPPCSYWFSSNRETGYPAYVKGANENSLKYQETEGGNLFEAKTEGVYEIEVNLEEMKIKTKSSPIYRLYMVTVTNGTESVQELKDIEFSSNVFNYTGTLTAGTLIRFSTRSNGSWPAYVPTANKESLVESSDESQMLQISKDGFYTITANIAEKKLIALDVWKIPNNGFWPVGDVLADLVNWDQNASFNTYGYGNFKQKDLKNHPEIWSFTLNFKQNPTGEGFKMMTVPSQWTAELVPSQNGIDPCNNWTAFGQKNINGHGDWKWHPNVTGAWTIQVDLYNKKLRMVQP